MIQFELNSEQWANLLLALGFARAAAGDGVRGQLGAELEKQWHELANVLIAQHPEAVFIDSPNLDPKIKAAMDRAQQFMEAMESRKADDD